MKRHLLLLLLIPFLLISCTKDNGYFTLIGKWAMVSGTITDSDGKTQRFEKLGAKEYYQYMEFRADGTLIKTTLPDKTASYGVYVYNDATRAISYKYDGYSYYVPGIISVISAKEMNLTTDYGPVGSSTQYFVKVR